MNFNFNLALEFQVEENFDFLYIYDEDGNEIAKLDGNSLPEPFVSSGNQLMLHFTSDGSVREQGFKIVFNAGI